MYKAALLCGVTMVLWIPAGGEAHAQQVFRRGDADGNGRLELTDAIRILHFLFIDSQANSLPCRDAADADDNGALELTDGIRVLHFLFIDNTNNPIPVPGPRDCGPDLTADPLSCASYDAFCEPSSGPLLAATPGMLDFTDGETLELSLQNAGEGTLEWTIATKARWLARDGTAVVEAPVSSAARETGLAAGESARIPLTAFPAGLPLGTAEGEVTISTNGGSVRVPARVTVTQLNLNGVWVGTFAREEGSLLPTPGIALDIEQTGEQLAAIIDGRLAPAFATSIRRQAHDVSFHPSEGSVALGALDVFSVPQEATVETWTLEANDGQSFAVSGSRSGAEGTALVGETFTTDDGMALLVSAPLNDRSYQPGDRFFFRVGSYGFVDGRLNGSLGAGLTGSFALDPDLSGVRPGVTRTMTFSSFDIVDPNVLEADLEIRHSGLLSSRDVVTGGRVRLSKRQ